MWSPLQQRPSVTSEAGSSKKKEGKNNKAGRDTERMGRDGVKGNEKVN